MENVLNVLLVVLAVVVLVFWIVSFLTWDGERPCEPGSDDRKTCPFPFCEDKKKKP